MPRRLYLMSGSFDSPPASDSLHETADRIVREILDNSTAPGSTISPSGELYRAIERFHSSRGTNTRLISHESNLPPMSSDHDPTDRRRRLQRESMEASPLFVLPPQPSSSEPTPRERSSARLAGMTARRGRPRLGASDRYLERHRLLNGESSASNGLADLQHAGRQLEAASSNLRSLLDDPIPNLSPPSHDPPEYSPEAEHGRRKRRKLDTDKLDTEFAGFSYGKYGQVEPGKLKMEIVSCDGGIYQEHGGDYSAENVLKNDGTVYCTKSNRCNLVLRHQGATVFCLKELIIKAPHSGYTAPIQEGMVFISMSSDDLLTRTAQYQIQYSPPRPRRLASPPSNELPPIMSIRHNGDGTMTTAQARARRLYDIGLQDEDCDFRTAQIPSDFTNNAPQFQVTTEFSDSEGDDDPRETSHRLRELRRNIGLRFEDTGSSSGEDDSPNLGWDVADYLRGPPLQRRETASNITLAEAAEASQLATQEAVRAVGGELMAPHARFFIERDKSKCTVRFDPPVSGRYILLKMWSPHPNKSENIDIQSVIAKGFAGPRFFPAVTLR